MGINQNQINELIEDWDWAVNDSAQNPNDPWYKAFVDPDVNDVEIKTRDKIHDLGLDNHPEVIKLEKQAIKYVLTEVGASYRKKPPQAKDKTRWWWHLDEISEGKYPAELLPEHLKEIYLKYLSHT